MAGNSDLVDLTMHKHRSTERAVFVSDDGDVANAVWLPLSQCEVAPAPGGSRDIVIVTLPEWLAKERGLV